MYCRICRWPDFLISRENCNPTNTPRLTGLPEKNQQQLRILRRNPCPVRNWDAVQGNCVDITQFGRQFGHTNLTSRELGRSPSWSFRFNFALTSSICSPARLDGRGEARSIRSSWGVSLPMVQNRATTWKNTPVLRPVMPKRAFLLGGCRWRLTC
ncbi:hypothetical protein CI102_219 [Trichoderma harzianum]|nr:hypothetical protein CI102_219 [Trichoderma harzianum]